MANAPPQAPPAPYAITGLTTGFEDKKPPCRRDIRDLYKNEPEQFNLYLLGLRAMHDMDFKDRLSYFQIAGIHGVPWQDWDGVQGRTAPNAFYNEAKNTQPDGNGGYCVHESILFPTWHRPYMMLFEQVLGNKMVEIAGQFRADLRPKYQKAAASWRLPYWDWLARPEPGQCTLPNFVSGYDPEDEAFNHPKIEVLQPSGDIGVIDNPLYSFTFDRPDRPGFERKKYMKNMNPANTNLKGTRRGRSLREVFGAIAGATPAGVTAEKAPADVQTSLLSSNGDVARGYNKQLMTAPTNLRNLLLNCSIYDQYASKKYNTTFGEAFFVTDTPIPVTTSIEKLHDIIHQNGGGFLALLQEASFDPLFWLHHCNIDRWIAIWEALHPDVPFIETKDSWIAKLGGTPYDDYQLPLTDSSYFLESGKPVDENTQLKPFHFGSGQNDFWTSKMCRRLDNLGYNYPELVRAKDETDVKFIERLVNKVSELYGDPGNPMRGFDSGGWPGLKGTGPDLLDPKSKAVAGDKVLPMKEIPPNVDKPLKGPAQIYVDVKKRDVPITQQGIIEAQGKLKPSKSIKSWETGYRTFSVTMEVEQNALFAGFGLYLFFGPVPSVDEDIFNSPTRVGNMVELSNDPQFLIGCQNCLNSIKTRLKTIDATDITPQLVNATLATRDKSIPALADMKEATVVSYLKTNLNWCIIQYKDGKYPRVDIKDPNLSSLLIKVRSEQPVSPGPKELLPKMTDAKMHPEVTKDKVGGWKGPTKQ